MPVKTDADEELLERAKASWGHVSATGFDRETFIRSLAVAEPYYQVSNFERRLREALTNE